MKTKKLKLIASSALLLFALPVFSQNPSGDAAAIFEKAAPELRQKTRVPFRYPTYFATEAETNPLYAIIERATPNGYELEVAFTPDCGGGNACRFGMVAGEKIASGAKRLRGKTVKLSHGVEGYFVDAKCGANCTDSTLTWEQDGYRYTVGIKAANVETLTKVANSAIENSREAN